MHRLLLAASLAACFAAPALAESRFDGQWGIEVRTTRGSCDPLYRFYVGIRNGEVRPRSMMGETGQVAGRVGRGGRIRGVLGSQQDSLAVRGRLRDADGGGTWVAPQRGCSGRWTAFRR
jgi:hypothetical protein